MRKRAIRYFFRTI